MERVRTECLRSLGVEQDRLLEEARRYFVVVGTYAEFLNPARFNEMLVATTRLEKLKRVTFLIEQCIYRQSLDGELPSRGRVKAACVDADTHKPFRVPAHIFED